MPELPDVEEQRRIWARHGAGNRIRAVSAPAKDVVRNTSPQGLGRSLHDRRLLEPQRHGKWLIAATGDRPRILLHFGMTGRLVAAANDEPMHEHDRVVFTLDSGELRLRMPRKLGGVWLARSEAEARDVTGVLGPDAWGADGEILRDRLGGRGALKPALMDQAKVAGLGNLLADEVLWHARIHPQRRGAELEGHEWRMLARQLRKVLEQSVEAGHVPAKDGWLTGARDDDQPSCPRCGTALERGDVGGRTTWWCPRCQQ